MEHCQAFWHPWWWTFKTALKKPHSSEITRTDKQRAQLNARFSPTEPKQRARQTAKQQAAKCYFTQWQDNHVVPLSITAHFWSSRYLLSLDKQFTGTCRNVHADIPSRRGSPYHGRDKLSFPEWIAAPQTPLPAWAPYLHGHSLGLPAVKSWRSCEPKMQNQALPALSSSIVTVPAVPEASLDPSCQFTTPSLTPPV